MSSRSTHVQAAADWIKEMTSPEAETQTWNKAGSLPVLLSSYSASPLRGDEQYNSYAWLVREGKVLPFEIDGAKKLDQVQKEKALLEKGEKDLKTFAEQIAKLYGAKSDS
ncbi:hypothetical protein N6H14_23140 [Paenibacillus sp. CC-CFT747]|nr:hypothetical protein N6H14_23140 [Paenibacillus sp. CC-CFT747]